MNRELGASDVPYFAQWESAELAQRFVEGSLPLAGDPRWAASGASTAVEYGYWANKVCGLACLKMILSSRGLPVPPMMTLVERALSWQAYILQGDRVAGLVYRPFADWVAAEYGITVEVAPDLPLAAVTAAASAWAPVIASVHAWIRWPDRSRLPAAGTWCWSPGPETACCGCTTRRGYRLPASVTRWFRPRTSPGSTPGAECWCAKPWALCARFRPRRSANRGCEAAGRMMTIDPGLSASLVRKFSSREPQNSRSEWCSP